MKKFLGYCGYEKKFTRVQGELKNGSSYWKLEFFGIIGFMRKA